MEGEYVSQKEHQEFVRRIEDEESRQNHRLTQLEEITRQIYDLSASVRELTKTVGGLAGDIKSQGNRLEEMEKQPGKNWTALQSGIISAIASAIGCGIVAAIISFM